MMIQKDVMEKDNEPVLVITDNDGYLIHVGHPRAFESKALAAYARQGYKIETITIKDFRAKEWKWIYDKSENS